MPDDRDHIAEEALLLEVDAEKLRQLVDHNHEAHAGLESGQHRFGDEVGQEPKPNEARNQ